MEPKNNKYLGELLLVLYMIVHAAFWYLPYKSILLLLQLLIFIGSVLLIGFKQNKVYQKITLIVVSNLLLSIFWYKNVHLNPEINWALNGNPSERDPWYLLVCV
jgi:hypothetical protein